MTHPGIIGYRIGDHVYDPADVTIICRTDWPGLGDEADVIPVPVLEALASAWEDQARMAYEGQVSALAAPGEVHPAVYKARENALANCARMLREAITSAELAPPAPG